MRRREALPVPEARFWDQRVGELEPVAGDANADTLLVCFAGARLRLGVSRVAFCKCLDGLPVRAVMAGSLFGAKRVLAFAPVSFYDRLRRWRHRDRRWPGAAAPRRGDEAHPLQSAQDDHRTLGTERCESSPTVWTGSTRCTHGASPAIHAARAVAARRWARCLACNVSAG